SAMAIKRSKENFTSSAVISRPSWNVMPCRSWKVYVRLSSDTVQDSAAYGSTLPSGDGETRLLYRFINEPELAMSEPRAGSIWLGQEWVMRRTLRPAGCEVPSPAWPLLPVPAC